MQKNIRHVLKKLLWSTGAVAALLVVGFPLVYTGHILPNVFIGVVPVGGLSKEAALERLAEISEQIKKQGFFVEVGGTRNNIPADAIGLEINAEESVKDALEHGRSGPVLHGLMVWSVSPFSEQQSVPIVRFDEIKLRVQVDNIADKADKPRKDVRLQIQGTSVKVLTDIEQGLIVDRQQVLTQISQRISTLDLRPTEAMLQADIPVADSATAPEAKEQTERMLRKPFVFEYDEGTFNISRDKLGPWIRSGYNGSILFPDVDEAQVRAEVAKMAKSTDRVAREPKFEFQNGRVIEFVPPHAGKALDQEKTTDFILEELEARRLGTAKSEKKISVAHDTSATVFALPVYVAKAAGTIPGNAQGISELIGKATTPFVGSPKNRISNIENGVKFLTGVIIQPGEEFSTLNTLGDIVGSKGYLPELVIKGDRTTPEFGGGLCQVSTTLFRAVLDAGLPVTRRQNHSYRVSYYERNGLGAYIGPGLDATIYEPDPDFRFKNDTEHSVLVFGYVTGTKATFELYGTMDGRVSRVIGPKILTEVPSGEPIYEETNLLAKGVTKQIEKPHPGGSATATYEVTYADGNKKAQVFKSWYRPWPARYLVGTKE